MESRVDIGGMAAGNLLTRIYAGGSLRRIYIMGKSKMGRKKMRECGVVKN